MPYIGDRSHKEPPKNMIWVVEESPSSQDVPTGCQDASRTAVAHVLDGLSQEDGSKALRDSCPQPYLKARIEFLFGSIQLSLSGE